LLKDSITERAVKFNYHDARVSVLEGAIARGDRKIAQVIWLSGFGEEKKLFLYLKKIRIL